MLDNKFFLKVSLFVLFSFSFLDLAAQNQWPHDIPIKDGGKVTIYQPQPESLDGDKLIGRAAVSVKKNAKEEPIFGAVFFTAYLSTEKDTRTAVLDSIEITNSKFPGVTDTSNLMKLERLIQTELPKWNIPISLDALVASIKLENQQYGTEQFKNDPPIVLYKDKPTTLVFIAGEPKVQKDKDLDADRVVNTPALIFKEGNVWNMYTGGVWYKSASIKEGWVPNPTLSTKVKSVNDQIKKQEKESNEGKAVTTKPEVTDIVISTVPTELLQTKGVADYKSIPGTNLLYVSNTSNDIFKDISSQNVYVLLAGRWYSAPKIEGPWTFNEADKLPADFAKIPPGSDKDNVLASVPGTDAAEDAKIDAQIPQTAKVDRKAAAVEVKYDGEPKFKPIDGTSLELAENSGTPVIKESGGKYFAVDNGIWYVSKSAKGPWTVSDERPAEVEKIPPSNSAYNTKYVYVYETTPEYVYVGYTPGYMGSYVYGPTVVYGTGYYYPPWVGSIFFPLPLTWGFGFAYNPWYGWGMGYGYGMGYMHVGFAFGVGMAYGAWFGAAMYRPPYCGGGRYYGGGGNNVIINNGDRNNIGNGGRNQINNDLPGGRGQGNNLYKDHKGVTTKDVNRGQGVSTREGVRDNKTKPSTRPSTSNNARNNVMADRNGNTFQRDNNGNWNQRDNQNRNWNSVDRNSNQARDMSRDYNNRNRGTQRTQNYQNRNHSYGGGSRGSYGGGGGMRGGGGGGRRR